MLESPGIFCSRQMILSGSVKGSTFCKRDWEPRSNIKPRSHRYNILHDVFRDTNLVVLFSINLIKFKIVWLMTTLEAHLVWDGASTSLIWSEYLLNMRSSSGRMQFRSGEVLRSCRCQTASSASLTLNTLQSSSTRCCCKGAHCRRPRQV